MVLTGKILPVQNLDQNQDQHSAEYLAVNIGFIDEGANDTIVQIWFFEQTKNG